MLEINKLTAKFCDNAKPGMRQDKATGEWTHGRRKPDGTLAPSMLNDGAGCICR
jgi:hypothetical protein